MSLFKSVAKAVGRVVKSPAVAGALTLVNPALGGALTAVQGLRSQFSPGAVAGMGSLPGLGQVATRGAAGAVGFGVGIAAGRARAIARGAAALCIKHPQWCSTIGGVAAVGAMMEAGQLPIPKRHRGRGLTPRDLRSFRRVARLIRVFAPTVRRIPHRALHVRGTGITHA
jgi:hypothetical protein